MESSDGTYSASADLPLRKKRSRLSRRPCSHPEKLLPLSPPPVASGINDGDSYRTASSDSVRGDGRLKKLKLKLGGVTHTIHARSAADGGGSTIQKSSQYLTGGYSSEKFQSHQDSTYGKNSSYRLNTSGKSVNANETYNHESVRKSKRVPKRRVIDVGYIEDDDDADDEIRYLGRPSASEKSQKISKVSDVMGDRVFQTYGSLSVGRDGRKISRSENIDNDEDYMEDEESAFDDDAGYPSKKFGLGEQRDDEFFQHTTDISLRSGSSFIEFPNGLPPAPSKKQKPKLTEVEQQLKRAEALQRRRMQSEKAAREAEAEAIRRILGQDSGRKKKEEKLKKQQEELAQEKAAKQDTLGPNTVRWITGPTGSVVIFSDDVGLPNVFSSLPCSYPPPREMCAGPNCTNAYKYRDSKLKIPLCSLSCYKTVQNAVVTWKEQSLS